MDLITHSTGTSKVLEGKLPCPVCPSSDVKKRYYQNNRAKLQARRLAHYREDPMAQAIRNARCRSKKKNWIFNIDKSDLVIPEFCEVLGLKLELSNGTKAYNSPSVDRIDNSKGYIKGNVRVISHRANQLKSNMSISECELILKDLKCHQ